MFARCDGNNLCGLKEGIPGDGYDATVEEIAGWFDRHAGNTQNDNQASEKVYQWKYYRCQKLRLKADDGSLLFGRVAVIPRGKVVDISSSFHSEEYELISKQGNAENLKQFSDSPDNENDDKAKGNAEKGISIERRNDIMAFLHKQAIDRFEKHCDYVLKTMNHGKDVIGAVDVEKNGEAAGEEKKNDWYQNTFYA